MSLYGDHAAPRGAIATGDWKLREMEEKMGRREVQKIRMKTGRLQVKWRL